MPFLAKLKKAFIPVDPKRALDAPPGTSRPHVFMDISIGDEPAGRIEVELFSDITPRTAENFKQLASGGHTSGGQKLGYAGSTFHRVVPEFMIQGGDFVNGNGTGMYSIYNGAFADENFKVKHQVSGLLSMVSEIFEFAVLWNLPDTRPTLVPTPTVASSSSPRSQQTSWTASMLSLVAWSKA